MTKRTKKPKAKAVKAKPVKVMSDELDRLRDCEDLVKRIERCEVMCDERAVSVEQARTDLKEIKGAYNAAVIELRRLCRARKEKLPLFDKAAEKPAETKAAAPAPTGDTPPAAPEGEQPVSDRISDLACGDAKPGEPRAHDGTVWVVPAGNLREPPK